MRRQRSSMTLSFPNLSWIFAPLPNSLYSTYTGWANKKRITSSECHSLKSKAITWIIFGHRFQVNLSLISTSKKTKVYFNQRGDKCHEIARGQFSKITETACLSGWEFEADKSRYRYGVYVTHHWNWMHSYWMLNRLPLWSSLGEQ